MHSFYFLNFHSLTYTLLSLSLALSLRMPPVHIYPVSLHMVVTSFIIFFDFIPDTIDSFADIFSTGFLDHPPIVVSSDCFLLIYLLIISILTVSAGMFHDSVLRTLLYPPVSLCSAVTFNSCL